MDIANDHYWLLHLEHVSLSLYTQQIRECKLLTEQRDSFCDQSDHECFRHLAFKTQVLSNYFNARQSIIYDGVNFDDVLTGCVNVFNI